MFLQFPHLIPILLLAMALAGCGRGSHNLTAIESRERQNTHFQEGLEAERLGEWKKAIACYEALLDESPKALSAHFQLAVLLHDHTDRLVEAIYHYSRYLATRGDDSEKKQVALARRQNAEQLLTGRLLAASGVSADADKAKIIGKNAELKTRLDQLEGQLKVAKAERAKLDSKVAALEKDNTRLRDLLQQVQSTPAKPSGPSASQVANDLRQRKPSPEADRKKQRLNEARALIKESETRPEETQPLPEVKPPSDEPEKKSSPTRGFINPLHEQEIPATVDHPKTYTVRPGDTLFRLAEEFYGDKSMWKKIRDLNRTVIDPDGRLRTGQTIKLP